jgi:hypothetical protein
MYGEWPPPGAEARVTVVNDVLPGTFDAHIELDDVTHSGGIQPWLSWSAVSAIDRAFRAMPEKDRARKDWVAALDTRKQPAILVVRGPDDFVSKLERDRKGRYQFEEVHGWRLADDLPPLAEFIVARARLRAGHRGEDVFDDLEERFATSLRAVEALGVVAREVMDLAVSGLDSADRLKDRVVLLEAFAKVCQQDAK